jgi:hypothetical protein
MSRQIIFNIYTHYYYNNHFVPESTTYDFTFNNIPYVTLKIEKKNLIVINLLLLLLLLLFDV